jgi:seryl-tRNA synthetase
VNVDIDKILKLDTQSRELRREVETIRAKRNDLSRQVEENTKGRDDVAIRVKALKTDLRNLEKELEATQARLQELLYLVPNPPADDVPEGKAEKENMMVKTWGGIPSFDFEIKDYIALMAGLDLVDLVRGAKIGGFRQYVLKGNAVILEQSLLRWSMDLLMAQGFQLMRPTSIVLDSALVGSGMFPQGREETYKIDNKIYLAGTTEVQLMAFRAGEILDEDDLPLKYVGFSPVFRKEVGSYGKDVKGIFRVHEFMQTEQVIICKADVKESVKWHEQLLGYSQQTMQALGLPYRVVNVCAGELTAGQVKRYDIEAWVPSQGKYRETHSDSYLLDFQTRRLNIQYKSKNGRKQLAHSLNNTGIAVPRILIPLLEIYQQPDGSILIPEVLQPYTGFKKIANH